MKETCWVLHIQSVRALCIRGKRHFYRNGPLKQWIPHCKYIYNYSLGVWCYIRKKPKNQSSTTLIFGEVFELPAAQEKDIMADFEITLKFSLINKIQIYDPDIDKAPNCLVPSTGGGGGGMGGESTASSRSVGRFGNRNCEASRAGYYFLDLGF